MLARANNMSTGLKEPELVFISVSDTGVQISERYFNHDSKGNVVYGQKTNEYTVSESIEEVVKRYGSKTTVLIEGVME